MTPVNTSISGGIIQPPSITKESAESSAPGAVLGGGVCCSASSATVFQVEHPNLGVACTCNDGSVVRVGHELDAEDVGMVAS